VPGVRPALDPGEKPNGNHCEDRQVGPNEPVELRMRLQGHAGRQALALPPGHDAKHLSAIKAALVVVAPKVKTTTRKVAA
jgi:hypothetical protein